MNQYRKSARTNRLVALAPLLLVAPVPSAHAADRQATRCVYSDLSVTNYADGPCLLEDAPPATGQQAVFVVTWLGGSTPAGLTLRIALVGKGEGASQRLSVDGRAGVGFDMTKDRYVIVTRDTRRVLTIEGQAPRQ